MLVLLLFIDMVLNPRDNAMMEHNTVVSGKKQLIMSKKMNSCKKMNNHQDQGHQK
jgi:hypothetical protein